MLGVGLWSDKVCKTANERWVESAPCASLESLSKVCVDIEVQRVLPAENNVSTLYARMNTPTSSPIRKVSIPIFWEID
jgi:hypothetical protein